MRVHWEDESKHARKKRTIKHEELEGVKEDEVMVYDDVGGDEVYVLTMTCLVCFPARLRSAYGIDVTKGSPVTSKRDRTISKNDGNRY